MIIDYQVQLIQFPPSRVHEAVAPNEDGSYTIFIDRNITYEMQVKCFWHAMGHIIGSDFGKEDAQKIEAEAHG